MCVGDGRGTRVSVLLSSAIWRLKNMSNSIGPCPTELDTLDSNIGAGSRWFEGYRSHSKARQAACLDHKVCTLQQERPLLQPPGSVATISICYCPIQLDRVQLVTARYPLDPDSTCYMDRKAVHPELTLLWNEPKTRGTHQSRGP